MPLHLLNPHASMHARGENLVKAGNGVPHSNLDYCFVRQSLQSRWGRTVLLHQTRGIATLSSCLQLWQQQVLRLMYRENVESCCLDISSIGACGWATCPGRLFVFNNEIEGFLNEFVQLISESTYMLSIQSITRQVSSPGSVIYVKKKHFLCLTGSLLLLIEEKATISYCLCSCYSSKSSYTEMKITISWTGCLLFVVLIVFLEVTACN